LFSKKVVGIYEYNVNFLYVCDSKKVIAVILPCLYPLNFNNIAHTAARVILKKTTRWYAVTIHVLVLLTVKSHLDRA
jgi:hypothetical protein